MSYDSPLTRRFPGARDLPHVELADLPTPVERREELGEALGFSRFYVKRDDRTAALYGGNKVRKLEFLLGDALRRGCRRVWTVGGIGSNHVLATCLFARQQGLQPHVLHFPQPVTRHVRDNLRALSTTRPRLRMVGGQRALMRAMIGRGLRHALGMDPGLYPIPMGGSSPVGVLGYVQAALELREQIEAGELPVPAAIFVAAGTGGTCVGLSLGCRLAGLTTDVVGVRVTRPLYANRLRFHWLARRTANLLRSVVDGGVPRPSPRDHTLLHEYFGEGYGRATAAGERALRVARRRADLTLEPTYTAKTLAALTGERKRRGLEDRPVLYWHTLSGADLGSRIQRADVEEDLPRDYRRFFREPREGRRG